MAVDMPSTGKRRGSSVMGGTRWEWEEEVQELAFEGLFRVDVRVHDTGELVDDTRATEQSKTLGSTSTTSSSAGTSNIAWTATVTGVVSSSRSQIRNAVAVSWAIDPSNPNPGQPPGTNPPPPKPGAPPAS
jgi:hypothetical protein